MSTRPRSKPSSRRSHATGSTTCTTRFVDALGEEAGVDRYRALARRVPARLPGRRSTRATAVADIALLEELDAEGDLELRLEAPAAEGVAHVKLYRAGGALVLSDVMPLLEHLGVTVVDEHPYEITAPGGSLRWIYSFGVRGGRGRSAGRPRHAGAGRRGVPRGVGRHRRERRTQPARAARRPRGARRGHRARAVPVPAAGGGALHRRVPGRHAEREPRSGATARRPVPRPARSRRRATTRPRSRGSTRSSAAPSTRWRASTPIASCARSGRWCAPPCAPTRTATRRTSRASSIRRSSTSCPGRSRNTRSGSRRRRSRACTCAPATSRAAASAGPTGARTSAPRSSG